MVKRDIKNLAIYQIEEEREYISTECLYNLYLEKTSEVIYVTKDERLYGIVCMGELLYGHRKNSKARINRSFTSLKGYNLVKAHEVFQKKKGVNKIPVVDEQGILLGDYSRWDDMLFVERNHEHLMQEVSVRKVLKSYERIYVVEPVDNINPNYLRLMEYLDCLYIKYEILSKVQIVDVLFENAICIFLNEDERIGTQCLHGIEPYPYDIYGNDIRKYDMVRNEGYKVRLTTYKNLLLQIIKETQLANLKIDDPIEFEKKNPAKTFCNKVDEKAAILLSELQSKGIKCFGLYNFESERTDYGREFIQTMNERLDADPNLLDSRWMAKVDKKAFYGELYEQEDYKREIAQNEMYYAENIFELKKNISGKYFNARDGKRLTCDQPQEYIGTIYLLGPCTIIGACVEDQYTIGSILQKKLLEEGYAYRVENYGSMIRMDSEIDSRLEEIDSFCENDIVLYQSGIGITAGIECESLEKIFEKYHIPSIWVADGYSHANHKANERISLRILEMIRPYLKSYKKKGLNKEAIHISFHDVMKDYIYNKYLCHFFPHWTVESVNTVGAIVMNGNPFHKGHKYLIEQAIKYVDTLIVFVVDDEGFMFPFEERFKMITEGTKDINNIVIVPNGDFVFSRNNFGEYYTQRYAMTTSLNAAYDLNVFADYIAKPLHITHRFAGTDPKGRIKKVYNETMKKILPQKGISFVEIPRMEIEGDAINSLQIQKYLENEEYDKAFVLVPESTKEYFIKQLNLTDNAIENRGVRAE